MKVVLTGAGSTLGQELVARLAANHQLLVLADEPTPIAGAEVAAANEWEPEGLKAMLAGADAVLHAACFQPTTSRGLNAEQAALDLGGRITYNLGLAAHQANVPRFVLLSTLELLAGYDPDLLLGPDFEPRPTTDPSLLGFYLAELLCREARRELGYFTLTLRLGRLVLEEEVAGQPYDPFWLDRRDAVAAVAAVLEAELPPPPPQPQGRLGVVNLCAARPDAATRQGSLARWTGYRPEHNFGYRPEEAVS